MLLYNQEKEPHVKNKGSLHVNIKPRRHLGACTWPVEHMGVYGARFVGRKTADGL